jgi:hypothetical protein
MATNFVSVFFANVFADSIPSLQFYRTSGNITSIAIGMGSVLLQMSLEFGLSTECLGCVAIWTAQGFSGRCCSCLCPVGSVPLDLWSPPRMEKECRTHRPCLLCLYKPSRRVQNSWLMLEFEVGALRTGAGRSVVEGYECPRAELGQP